MNVVVLVGRLVRDPEIRYTQSQTAVCTATLAVDRPFARDNQDQNRQTADFIRLTIFGKRGETFQKYLVKGRQVAVEGRIQTGSYVNQKGDTVYTTDVIVSNFDFIGSKNDGNSNSGYGEPQRAFNRPQAQNNFQNNQDKDQSDDVLPAGFETIDDIPF